MNFFQKSTITAFGFLFFCLFSQALYAQDFSSVDADLMMLEDLIRDTIANTTEQQKLLESLKTSLDESGNLIANYEIIITEQEKLLADLRHQLNEMSETYKTRSALSEKYEKSSKFWKTFTIIAVPAAALISGGIVLAVCN